MRLRKTMGRERDRERGEREKGEGENSSHNKMANPWKSVSASLFLCVYLCCKFCVFLYLCLSEERKTEFFIFRNH
jgi:hypothetical protein